MKSDIADVKNAGGRPGGQHLGRLVPARVRRRLPVGAPRHRGHRLHRPGGRHPGEGPDRRRRAAVQRVRAGPAGRGGALSDRGQASAPRRPGRPARGEGATAGSFASLRWPRCSCSLLLLGTRRAPPPRSSTTLSPPTPSPPTRSTEHRAISPRARAGGSARAGAARARRARSAARAHPPRLHPRLDRVDERGDGGRPARAGAGRVSLARRVHRPARAGELPGRGRLVRRVLPRRRAVRRAGRGQPGRRSGALLDQLPRPRRSRAVAGAAPGPPVHPPAGPARSPLPHRDRPGRPQLRPLRGRPRAAVPVRRGLRAGGRLPQLSDGQRHQQQVLQHPGLGAGRLHPVEQVRPAVSAHPLSAQATRLHDRPTSRRTTRSAGASTARRTDAQFRLALRARGDGTGPGWT